MRVKIISPGRSCYEARVVDAETGQMLEGVSRVQIDMDADRNIIEAIVTIRDPLIEMEAEIKKQCATTGRVFDA